MLAYLSLGANLGNKEQTIDTAVQLINTQVGNVIRRSSYFYSKPWGFNSPNQFCNICLALESSLSPLDLLHQLQAIEQQLGKDTHSQKTIVDGIEQQAIYHDRVIDIDLLTYGDIVINTPELTLPHPHMNERDFVLIPLKEVENDTFLVKK